MENKFKIIKTPIIRDPRGNLTVGEFGRDIPFQPVRYFVIFQVPLCNLRGEHAHKVCHQFLICLRGSVMALADDGIHKAEFKLEGPNIGLYMPPMTWGAQYSYSPDALLLVFASHYYDEDDYIRSYADFIGAFKS